MQHANLNRLALSVGLAALVAAFLFLSAEAIGAPAGWGPARTLARGAVHDVAAASAGNGAALVAWRVGGRRPAIAVRTRAASGAWRRVVRFRPRNRTLGAPAVAVDARGGMVLAWSESRGRHARRIVAALATPAGRWRTARTIGRTGKTFPAPVAAVAPSGEAVVVWRYDSRLQAAFRRPRARAFGTPRLAGTGAQQRVAYAPRRRALLLFAPLSPGPVRLATSARGHRRFGRAHAIAPTGPASFPDLAIAPDGTLAVAWRASPVPTVEDLPGPIEVAVRPPGGAFGAPTDVSGTQFDDQPSIAIAPGGDILVAWHHVGEPAETRVARRSGIAWSAPAGLGEGAQFDRPQAAFDARGTAIVGWLSPNGLRARSSVGGAWTPPATLGARAGYWPVVTEGPTVLAAWIGGRTVRERAWNPG